MRWGELNPTGIHHPLSGAAPELAELLDLPGVPVPGCAESVHAFRTGFGPAMGLVVAPGHHATGLLHLPGGQSGDPQLSSYRDQFAEWRNESEDGNNTLIPCKPLAWVIGGVRLGGLLPGVEDRVRAPRVGGIKIGQTEDRGRRVAASAAIVPSARRWIAGRSRSCRRTSTRK
ncbi:penicillin acylase family protein [Planotetraspora sp. GP83]|uniref:penicillin acylase family protein n=1 Tax=Planotetraspora sp. GP83 TaxID=3156264 RepID=UPI0035112F9F